MTPKERWLAYAWPTVRAELPPPPAEVVEIGCGSLGGFVPVMRDCGYRALGIDPAAPEGQEYQRVTFEDANVSAPVDAVVACTSLHHVESPAAVVGKIADSLRAGGIVIVVEWDWPSFDEASARWCFDRLGPPEPKGWLHHAHERWTASGQPWTTYFHGWVEEHGLHTWERLEHELDRRLERVSCRRGPYFFTELADTSEADELEAINAGRIRANRVNYVGTRE
jgi:SAM-dependent methyltransferase